MEAANTVNKRLIKADNASQIPNKSFQKRFISTLSHFEQKKYQSACKPGFVPMKLPSRCMAIHLEHLLPNASRNQPGQRAGKSFEAEAPCRPY
jgi:hypothetical protein